MSYQFVFNQYYIDLIKRLKTASKQYKESDEMEKIQLGRKVLKSIKENYVTIDKSSDVYLRHIQNIPSDFWNSYLDLDMDCADDWFTKEEISGVQLYENIAVDDIYNLIQDKYLCHHFLTVFYLFRNEMSNDQIMVYVKYLQGNDKDITIDNIENEEHKKILLRLKEIRIKNIKDNTNIDLKSIEDTTLGKLAKEILEDVDVEKIQRSIGEKGDVLKAIGDPDSGFTELITSVSRKMANKISSGELKQENLLQDAMKFASVMPGLFGGKGGQGGSGSGGGPDMAHMMDLMSSMMGNKEGMDMFKNMAAQMKTPKGSRPSFDNSALKRMAAAKKMKAKLHKKKETEASQEAASNEDSK
jgi:hypothetical protein